nr:hypothetical protein AVEN_258344-1 [Araneus ventricosus]GBN57932.1 hypothetical protein AVEN_122424-1 [Araneus ventricosus]
MCRSLQNESADLDPQKEPPDPIPTKRNESAESDLLIPRHHDSDSESLIRIHNLRRGLFRSRMNGTSIGVMDADKFLRVEQEMLRFG